MVLMQNRIHSFPLNGVLKAASRYVPDGHWFENPRFYRDQRPFEIGPFRITPLLVDHSAFDAYALLVEADGRRLCNSGDFRVDFLAEHRPHRDRVPRGAAHRAAPGHRPLHLWGADSYSTLQSGPK